MAALAARRQPVLVPRRGPALVPTSGVAAPPPATPLAAVSDEAGALGNPLVQSGGASPLASAALSMAALDQGHGGAAHGALISHPDQPDVMYGDDGAGGGGGGGPDIGTMLALLGKAAGKAGPLSGPTADGGAQHIAPTDSGGGGILDKIKSLFLGDAAKKPDIAAAQVQTPDIAPPGALDPNDIPQPVLDAPTPTPRPVLAGEEPYQIGDPHMAERQVSGPAIHPNLGRLNAGTPALPQEEPGYFDRLTGDPLRMALLTGGLGTMAAASRRGATPLGAIGEGALGGVKTVFEQRAADKQRQLDERRQDLADQRETSESVLRNKQGAFYDARTTAEPEKTQIAGQRAGAALTNAAAHQKSADASMVRADAYADGVKTGALGGKGGSGNSVFHQKQQAWLAVPGHENDLQGALDYAAGHKTMSGGDRYLAARRLATSQINAMVEQPDDPEKAMDQITSSIMDKMDANDSARGNGQPGNKGSKGGPALGGPAANSGGALADAKYAIAHGAPRDKVIQRLKAKNIDPSGL